MKNENKVKEKSIVLNFKNFICVSTTATSEWTPLLGNLYSDLEVTIFVIISIDAW
jgi:hypothetical protein